MTPAITHLKSGCAVIALLSLAACTTTPRALTGEQRAEVAKALDAKALIHPNTLEVAATGFVVATWEVSDDTARLVALPRFAEDRLLVIREALRPFGFTDYRVNLNGPSPGTGLVRRYGAARLIDGGRVEWVTP